MKYKVLGDGPDYEFRAEQRENTRGDVASFWQDQPAPCFHQYSEETRKRIGVWVSPTALYRSYDWGGDLLCIGITHDPVARDLAHSKDSAWRRDAAVTLYEYFPVREIAETAEYVAIKHEQPPGKPEEPLL
ncbi:hypothetical protein [Sulfitobacter faviae]|uniref:hypothetical protein n=1 Tax=Sulfitobacter faviae TaxID=1775881 RepID=UPI00398CB11D